MSSLLPGTDGLPPASVETIVGLLSHPAVRAIALELVDEPLDLIAGPGYRPRPQFLATVHDWLMARGMARQLPGSFGAIGQAVIALLSPVPTGR